MTHYQPRRFGCNRVLRAVRFKKLRFRAMRSPETEVDVMMDVMKRVVWLLGIVMLLCAPGWAQQKEESLGDAARRVRAWRATRNTSKIRLFTNDNLPRTGGITIMSGRAAASNTGSSSGAQAADAGKPKSAEDSCGESCWRGKFDGKRKAIADAEHEIDILTREKSLNQTQFSMDPNASLKEQYSNTPSGGPGLQETQNKIDQKKADLARLKDELRTLESELRAAGKPAGWGRAAR